MRGDADFSRERRDDGCSEWREAGWCEGFGDEGDCGVGGEDGRHVDGFLALRVAPILTGYSESFEGM